MNHNRQSAYYSLAFAAILMFALVVLVGTSGCDYWFECGAWNNFCDNWGGNGL